LALALQCLAHAQDAKNYVVKLEETADSFALLLKMDVKLAAESKNVTSQNQKVKNAANVLAKVKENLKDVDTAQFSAKLPQNQKVKNAANVLAKVKENLKDVDTAQFSAKLPQNQEANDVAKNSAKSLNVDTAQFSAGVGGVDSRNANVLSANV
jgi:flagellin-like hook-associated protein FlgL